MLSKCFANLTWMAQAMFHKDFKEFIELLNKHDVEYLLIGGYALGIHGYPRYTGDMIFG